MFLEKISLTEEAYHRIKRHVHHPFLLPISGHGSTDSQRRLIFLNIQPEAFGLQILFGFHLYGNNASLILQQKTSKLVHSQNQEEFPASSSKRSRSFGYLMPAPRSISFPITHPLPTFPLQKACISTEA